MTMYNTLLLDQDQWDLVIDSNGNIAMAAPPYALAQDVASAVRTFKGEIYYDTTQGIPYFEQVLGKLPPLPVITQFMSSEAEIRVPGVVTAQTVIQSFSNGEITGQVQFTDESGGTQVVNFT